MDFRGSLDPKTLQALTTYATTDRPKGESRILLKVEDDGQGHRYLKAVDEKDLGFFEKWIGLFFRNEYRLQNLAEFFESQNFSLPDYKDCTIVAKALQKLDGKIKKHNESLFSRTVQLKYEGLTTLFEVKLLEKQLITIEDKLEIEDPTLQENLQKQIHEIQPRIEQVDKPALKRKFHIVAARCEKKRTELQKKVEAQPKTPRNSSLETLTPIEADRNCLLRSVACGLYLAGQFPEELGNPHTASPQLRHTATEYISKNYESDDALKSLLTSAIAEHNEAKKKKYEDEKLNLQAILDFEEGEQITEEDFEALEKDYQEEIIGVGDFKKFIELTAHDDFDTSAPHLYALSRHFQVNFEVYQIIDKGRISTWEKMPFIPPLDGAKATIQLQLGVHFNAIRQKGVTVELPEPPPLIPEEVIMPPAPEPQQANLLADKYGYKLVNKNNACYVNSVTQALRQSPQFRACLQRTKSNNLAKIMKEAYTTLEQKHSRFELDSKDFRSLAMKKGFRARSVRSQEDAEEFCRFLLNEMKMPAFKYQIEKAHTLPFTPPSLKSKPITDVSPTDVSIPLALGSNPADTTLQTLVNNNFIKEEADLLGILISSMRGDLTLTPEQRVYIEAQLEEKAGKELKEKILAEIKKVDSLVAAHPENVDEITESEGIRIYGMLSKEEAKKTKIEIDTHQKLALDPANLPEFLPLSLRRFDADRKKIFTEINPWRTVGEGENKKEVLSLEIPIAGDQTRTQEYRLIAVVVHSGWSIEGGHYYTFVPQVVDGKEVWLKFDDLGKDVAIHEMKEKDVVEDIKKNGYLFFYERVVPE